MSFRQDCLATVEGMHSLPCITHMVRHEPSWLGQLSLSQGVATMPLQAMIEQLMAEWHVKDFAVAESIFKSRQRQLKQKSSGKIKARMQVSRVASGKVSGWQ